MTQFLPILFSFVTFLSLLGFTEMIEFCDAFEDNSYAISYGYQRIRSKNQYLMYLFIGSNYWELSYNDESIEVTFMSNDSKTAENWFGSGYSMAFCVKTPNNQYTTYLLQKSHEYWEYGILDDNENQLKISGHKNSTLMCSINVTNRKALEKGIICFVPANSETTVVLFNQRGGPDYDIYVVNETNKDPFDPMFEYKKLYTDYRLLMNLDPYVEIVAIFGQFKWLSSHISEADYGLIILFKVKKSLKYCWSLRQNFSENCNPKNLNLLINCSKPLTTTVTPETETQLSGILIFLAIVIFLIIVLIFLICIGGNAKNEPSLETVQTPKRKDKFFQSIKQKNKEKGFKKVEPSKAQAFKTERNVNHSTIISPLDSKADVRPTDLVIQKK